MRAGNGTTVEKWMDGEDVCRLLRLSPKTLQSMRDRGIVACSQVGRKFYYRSEEWYGLFRKSRRGHHETGGSYIGAGLVG